MKAGCGPGATTELPVQTHSILLSFAPETCKEAMHPVGKRFFLRELPRKTRVHLSIQYEVYKQELEICMEMRESEE